MVARPTVKGEIRLTGLDDSTTEDETRSVLAETDGCSPEDITTGPVRPMRNGMGTIWAQGPLTAMLQSAALEKIKVGWTVARIELLRARPMQCFRCRGYGHVRSGCQAENDRSNMCYRCGSSGHTARNCNKKPACAICLEKGLNDNHRMGLTVCALTNPKTKQATPGRRNRESHNDGPKGYANYSEQWMGLI